VQPFATDWLSTHARPPATSGAAIEVPLRLWQMTSDEHGRRQGAVREGWARLRSKIGFDRFEATRGRLGGKKKQRSDCY
jgi:hypothetical protein